MKLRAVMDAVVEARKRAETECYCRRDMTCQPCAVVMGAESELTDALLASRAVEAVEVLMAYGRANRECWKWLDVVTRPSERIEDERRRSDARDALYELADALAEGD